MKKVVKMFTATWCQTCKPVKTTLLKMQGEHPEIVFEFIDADESTDTARYNIRGLPTIILELVSEMGKPEELARLTGDTCQRRIEEYLKKFEGR